MRHSTDSDYEAKVYDLGVYVKWENHEYDVLNSEFLKRIPDLPIGGETEITISKAPDAISFEKYDTHDLFWLVMWYNGVHDVEDLVYGKLINFPTFISVSNQVALTL